MPKKEKRKYSKNKYDTDIYVGIYVYICIYICIHEESRYPMATLYEIHVRFIFTMLYDIVEINIF